MKKLIKRLKDIHNVKNDNKNKLTECLYLWEKRICRQRGIDKNVTKHKTHRLVGITYHNIKYDVFESNNEFRW